LGVTIPTRWRRSRDDIQRAIELGLTVRLVKGQWEDATHPVDPLENAQHLLDSIRSLAKRPSRDFSLISVASHDLVYLKKVLKILQKQEIPNDIEQFFSLPINGENVAQEFNTPLSIYVAYGSPALPYNIRFSFTRPRLAFWMASDYLLPKKRAWEVH
jgi:proline dehydrogenase